MFTSSRIATGMRIEQQEDEGDARFGNNEATR